MGPRRAGRRRLSGTASRPVVAVLTDYGAASEYVGALHLALARLCPLADRVDLAHDVPPGDIAWGALLLAWLLPVGPVCTTVAVVDPGVGTERRGVALACANGGFLVGPDNGLLAPAARALGVTAAVELRSEEHRLQPVAPTFHGLHVFAPAAAHLTGCGALGDLGPAVDPAGLTDPAVPPVRVAPGRLEASVVACDRFGNLALGAPGRTLEEAGLAGGRGIEVAVGYRRRPARAARVFGDVPAGELLVHVDSHGLVALAVNGGSAAALLAAGPGDAAVLRLA
jgi:S-adenosyl-L-methionine hydrolase (adenosine-forming)